MKGGDLIVVEVGCNECLCGEGIGHPAHEIQLDAEPFEPLEIQRRIVSHRSHDQRIGTEELQVISDVARATSELAPQLGNEERHVQYVDLFGKDVLPETAAEYHDVVVRNRAADQGAHCDFLQVKQVESIAGRLECRSFDVDPDLQFAPGGEAGLRSRALGYVVPGCQYAPGDGLALGTGEAQLQGRERLDEAGAVPKRCRQHHHAGMGDVCLQIRRLDTSQL